MGKKKSSSTEMTINFSIANPPLSVTFTRMVTAVHQRWRDDP
jgi:hypothetical protein